MKALNIGGISIPVPIFQGGMGIGVSMSNLAAAVAKCGGVGVISAAQPGYREADFYRNPIEANGRALQKNIKDALHAIKDLPQKGAIGVNIMCAGKNYDELVKASIEAGVQFIISGAGLPTSLPGLCKGSKVKLIPIVSSARAAAIIIKNWAKKFDRVPDAVIFEGPEAGGHLGFKEEQLEIAQEDFYKTITEIKRELEPLTNCPLIVGGGIYHKSDMEKAMAYGADAVQIGSRFVTTEECDVHENFKKAYLNCKKEDITIIKSPVGMPGRAIRNAFIKKVEQGRIPPERCNGCITSCKPATAMYCITEALISAAKGDMDNGLIFCGSKTYQSEKIDTVADVFAEFCGKQ
ncbi:MAG: nitronate monooxygenase family protein [Anaerovorax sp.]